MKHRRKLNKRASKRKFMNTALNVKNINLSSKPKRGGIRM